MKPNPGSGGVSYWRSLADLAFVLSALGVVAWFVLRRPEPEKPPPAIVVELPEIKPEEAPAPPPVAEAPHEAPPAPMPPEPRPLDHAAIATAEAALDAASRDRARADARLQEATLRLESAQTKAAHAAFNARTLSSRIKNPAQRIASARARGQVLKVERDKMAGQLRALASVPKPRAKPLVDKSPVARPPDGDEFHFELHRNRVAFIDLERLIDEIKSDARIQMRLTNGRRTIESQVGPVGDFGIQYALGRALPAGVQELLDGNTLSYDLLGWEIIPAREVRGESYQETRLPGSSYRRAVNRLDPNDATITFWVYPDSFAIYRQLRDYLYRKDVEVAGRPLPAGVPIRASRHGSRSRGQ